MFRGSSVPAIAVADVKNDAYLLDVREDDEWTAGHAPGAVHMPMMQIPARIAEIPADRDVVVVCRVGGRSAQVVAFLQQNGLERTINLNGGMQDWAAAGRAMVSEDGGAPRVA
ncbi:rhodanese-like domain-containing protein [Dactylosporangium sp. AC04546]|uniref:rhodanese-like domain-containing protein n=1 Tax=Dactylosporangium sp. AC04546 TaxID=2862460 RepID=UPI001EDF3ED0|nr:rhodanese-like domain-containing protein [Dactylosporangium sp. AC04546]WVK83762.1 rhodanese-like domain-containing protein [Dactylosporangium sp. AC04546]